MRLGIVGLACLVLAGCATKYQEKGFTGGYEELQLSADTFRISVSGNGYTSTTRAENIAMLRAADLTMQRGYERFVILSGNVSQQYAGSTDVTINRVGNTLVASGGEEIRKPGGSITVRLIAKSDPGFATALDARMIAAQLRPKLS